MKPDPSTGNPLPKIVVSYPDWVGTLDWKKTYRSDEQKMELAIEISRRNVSRATGGPFGTAIFEIGAGRLLAIGMNLVVPLSNSTLHGEMVAIQMAEQRLERFSLAPAGDIDSTYELFTSCEPCAMCLGGVLWSGVRRLVCGATGEDARAIGFDEGPVFKRSWEYLRKAGIEVVRGLAREQAREVLRSYTRSGGAIYNGQ